MSTTLQCRAQQQPRIGLGISSFTLGAIGTLSFVLLAVYVGVVHNTGGATPAVKTMIGDGMVLVWITNLIGVGLGIAGAVNSASRKTFPILGLVLNSSILATSAAIIAIGLRTG
jgi:hypothetical protein